MDVALNPSLTGCPRRAILRLIHEMIASILDLSYSMLRFDFDHKETKIESSKVSLYQAGPSRAKAHKKTGEKK